MRKASKMTNKELLRFIELNVSRKELIKTVDTIRWYKNRGEIDVVLIAINAAKVNKD